MPTLLLKCQESAVRAQAAPAGIRYVKPCRWPMSWDDLVWQKRRKKYWNCAAPNGDPIDLLLLLSQDGSAAGLLERIPSVLAAKQAASMVLVGQNLSICKAEQMRKKRFSNHGMRRKHAALPTVPPVVTFSQEMQRCRFAAITKNLIESQGTRCNCANP